MKYTSIEEAWDNAIKNSNTNMNEEDICVLVNLEKMLGKTEIEGQISEIKLTKGFIDEQIRKAEEEKRKNEKLYKSLGITIGLAMIIIFI